MSKTLVACFSATGNTERIAEAIAKADKADLFRIKPVEPYTSEDLDWHDKQSRTTREMNDAACRPAIADKVGDMAEYKTIFLGFPIWWYEAPRIIYTFLGSYDFSGKVMIPFVTSGGSGLGAVPELLKKACPAATWLPGKRFSPNATTEEVESWAHEHVGWKK